MKENIHNSIAALAFSLFHDPPTYEVVRAPECGGDHRAGLFTTAARNRETNYCGPDIVITRNREVRVILEIEQTGIVSPSRVGGKLMPIALSNYLYADDIGLEPAIVGAKIMLVQVVNTAQYPRRSRKYQQYESLQSSIRGILPFRCVREYHLMPVVGDSAPPYDGAKYDSILRIINDSLTAGEQEA